MQHNIPLRLSLSIPAFIINCKRESWIGLFICQTDSYDTNYNMILFAFNGCVGVIVIIIIIVIIALCNSVIAFWLY